MKTDYQNLLNERQFEAVSTRAQHVRIIAGAGSGKTRVLTYRIAYLIEEMGVDPRSILAMTFTNKAATEMKERVAKLVPSAAFSLLVSTFHSFCNRFLRMEIHNLGYPASFTIIDDDDQEKLVKEIAESEGYKKSDPLVKSALHYISSKKSRGVYPEDIVISHHSFDGEKECLHFYQRYEERKQAMLCLDFDDLLLFSLQILENFPEVRHKWAFRYQHILVDEFQDTNDVQYRLMKLLSTPDTYIYVVGDPDQTIYTWRGANQRLILNFPEEYPDYIDIVLDRNYRSTANILNGANRLISFNKKRVPKNLYTQEGDGEPVTCKKFDTPEEEAKFIADEIINLASKSFPPDFKEIAVLYRSSYLTRPLEAAFATSAIPYRIYGGLRFYERREVKDVLAYFRVFLNPKEDISFARIYNVPKRGIGQSSFALFQEEARHEGLSYYEYASALAKGHDSDLPKRAIKEFSDLVNKMEATKIRLETKLETFGSVLKDFITDIGYYSYIAEDEAVDEDRGGNVNALFDDINAFISKNPESGVDEYLQNIALLTSQDDVTTGNHVTLMTIHTAKGLEFDNVFVMGMNSGAFPSMRSLAEEGRDGLEEERRLAYVAFTRARKRLTLTCNTSYSYVTSTRNLPSQFFSEAGFSFPKESLYSSYGGASHFGKKENNRVGFGRRNFDDEFFGDGDHIDPFASKPKEAPKPKPRDNGIKDWKIGDLVSHDAFGDGVVVAVLDDNIFIVKFDDGSRRTMLSTHPKIHRKLKKGAQA